MYDFTELKQFLDSVVEKGAAPGCQIRITKNHEALFEYQTGYTDVEKTRKLTSDTAFHIYSASKPILVATVMKLYELGKISLDDKLSKYIPEFKDAFIMNGEEKITCGDEIKIVNLLTMSSGLNYDIYGKKSVMDVIKENPNAGTVEIVKAFAKEPLAARPATAYIYSLSHDVLAAVCEIICNKPFGEVVKEYVFEPLEMNRSYYGKKFDKNPDLSELYFFNTDEQKLVRYPSNDFDITDNYESGGAGVISVLDDYAAFCDAISCGGVGKTGKQILKQETIDLIRRDTLSKVANGSQCGGECIGYTYGLGVRTHTIEAPGNSSSIGEYGWDGAAGTYMAADPNLGLSIVYMQHVLNWPNALGGALHNTIRELTYKIVK